MLEQLRIKARQARRFAEDHPTIVACGATALVTHKVTKKITFDSVMREAGKFAYEKGFELGFLQEELNVQNDVVILLMEYINKKGLTDDLRKFVESIKED